VFFSQLQAADEGEDEPELNFSTSESVVANVQNSEQQKLIESALQKLPDHQRIPLVLYHFEDMPYEEIAQQLKVSLPKVKTDIHRARIALAKVLARHGITTASLES